MKNYRSYRHYYRHRNTGILMALLSIAGIGMASAGVYYATRPVPHLGTMRVAQPPRTIIKREYVVKSARQHHGRYLFYRDFANRHAWVSMRVHGKFKGSVCEAAALLSGLRLEGLVKKVTLYHFAKNYVGFPAGNGRTAPSVEYDRDPYIHHGASVHSKPIANAAERAGSRAMVIDGAQPDVIVNYLKQGHPVYVEAGHKMHTIWHGKISDHTLILTGIREDRHGNIQIKYMDSNCNHYRDATGWCSLQKFLTAWQRPTITGERAVVLLGRNPQQQIRIPRGVKQRMQRRQKLVHAVARNHEKSSIISKK